MQPVSKEEALKRTADLLADWLKVPKAKVRWPRNDAEHKPFRIGNHAFVIQFKATSNSAQIYSIVRSLKELKIRHRMNPILIIASPFMGATGIDICKKEGVSWLDLSGNADISAPGLRILIQGRPNLFKSAGRPSSPFAPKSARIARLLLMHPGRPMSQREIATESGIDEGFTSRIVSHLEADGLITQKMTGGSGYRIPTFFWILGARRTIFKKI